MAIPARTVLRHRTHTLLAAYTCMLLAGGIALHVTGYDHLASWLWIAAIVMAIVAVTRSVVRSLIHGRVGVDIIALLAMAGALALDELLAGAVIALMLAGGSALEEYAQGRASKELTALAERAPREAHVLRAGSVSEVDAADVRAGDVVVVRAGEIVPVDGIVIDRPAVIDQSTLTGEPLPVTIVPGCTIMSGSTNAGESFEVEALRTAQESMYESIVRLVEDAVARRAPLVRMADRFAGAFLVLTLVLSAAAGMISTDPVRALAVLVIATPCPLILAPPVALVAGTSRAARRGIIVKGGGAIEALGRTTAVLIDKTGTLTLGRPHLMSVDVADSRLSSHEVLRLAGAVEQMSVHSLAEAVAHAATRESTLPLATSVTESPGQGIAGDVDGCRVVVGSSSFLADHDILCPQTTPTPHGVARAFVGVDGRFAGTLMLEDLPRPDAALLAGALRKVGVHRIAMVTGDHLDPAQRVAAHAGIVEVHAECTPTHKLEILNQLMRESRPGNVVMVGDGVNDAPALAASDVGIAMGSAGATAASESAQAVILSDHISRVAQAIAIGRRSRSIALQSIVAGMTLSIIGMIAAAAGYLPPVHGALTQEAIDLAVIINALRALADGSTSHPALP